MINPVYKLSEDERNLAVELGKKRNQAKEAKLRNIVCGYSNPETPHILGICAEIAYAKITNRKLDENLYAIGDNSDFDGIEIKTSTWRGIDIELKVKISEFNRKHPMAYVLARIDKDYTTVEFVGSISRQKFDKIKYIKKHKFVENYCVSGNQIRKGLAFVEDNILKISDFQNT
jgi:hypothetical protein